MALPIAELHLALNELRLGDIDGAHAAAHSVAENLFNSGGTMWDAFATTVLVEALLQRYMDAARPVTLDRWRQRSIRERFRELEARVWQYWM